MKESIPGLMNAIKMIFSISSYYNTPEQLTYLFAKVSVLAIRTKVCYALNLKITLNVVSP